MKQNKRETIGTERLIRLFALSAVVGVAVNGSLVILSLAAVISNG